MNKSTLLPYSLMDLRTSLGQFPGLNAEYLQFLLPQSHVIILRTPPPGSLRVSHLQEDTGTEGWHLLHESAAMSL